MVGDYEQNQDWARRLFLSQVAPRLIKHLPGKIHAVEGEAHPVCRLLDMNAGIDYLLESPNGNVRTIASRIQIGNRCWATFTIRKQRTSGALTEHAKRIAAIGVGALSPFLSVHAYFDTTEHLLGFAAVRTDHLFQAIVKGLCKERRTGAMEIGQATFLWVAWRDIFAGGWPIIIHDHVDGVTLIRSRKEVREYLETLSDEEVNEGFNKTIDQGDSEE